MPTAAFPAGLSDLATALQTGSDTVLTMLEVRAKEEKRPVSMPWIKDRELQGRLTALQEAGDALSKATTRLTLVVSKDPSEGAVASIVEEMVGLVHAFVGRYLHVVECSVGDPLHQTVTVTVRGELRQLVDLVALLSDDVPGNSRNSRTGMVWKASDALKTLPLSNKAAYRRFVLERMVAVKDTAAEFEGYLAVVKSDLARSVRALTLSEGDDEDDDEIDDVDVDGEEDDDDDLDVADYKDADVPLLEESVATIALSLDMLKAGLAVMTSVGDTYARAAEEEASLPLPPPPPPSQPRTAAGNSSHAGTETSEEDAPFRVDTWVAAVSAESGALEGAVTDFGAALYPPLDDEARVALARQAGAWREVAERYLRLLLQPACLPGGGSSPWQADAQAVADAQAALADVVRRSTCLFAHEPPPR